MKQLSENSILVVDDDDVFRLRLKRAFSDRGFETGEASSIKEACDYVLLKEPSMAVIDLKLAHESGLELLKKILEIKNDIRIVVLTGYGTISTAVTALKLGAINYLTKPVDADTVLNAFKNAHENANSKIAVPHLAQVEWDHIQRVINDCEGNISKASKALGVHRRSLQRKLLKNPSKLR